MGRLTDLYEVETGKKENKHTHNERYEMSAKWLAMIITSYGDHYVEVRLSSRIFGGDSWGRFDK